MHEEQEVELPALDLTAIQLPDGQWAVVSSDTTRPLTEEQARKILCGYQAIFEILAGNIHPAGGVFGEN